MENRNNGKVVAVIALFVAVIGLSVGFAALSTTLNFTGTATVKASNWNIDLGGDPGEQPKEPTTTGGQGAQKDAPVFEDQTVTFSVIFKQPKDSVSYEFKVKNSGDIAAKVSDITPTGPVCSGDEQAETVCSKIEVTLTHKNGGQPVKAGDKLAAGGEETLVWTMTYDKNAELTADQLPTSAVSVDQSKITVNFEQDTTV